MALPIYFYNIDNINDLNNFGSTDDTDTDNDIAIDIDNDHHLRFDWEYIENGSPNQSTTLLPYVF
jgi:hypothetical protein